MEVPQFALAEGLRVEGREEYFTVPSVGCWSPPQAPPTGLKGNVGISEYGVDTGMGRTLGPGGAGGLLACVVRRACTALKLLLFPDDNGGRAKQALGNQRFLLVYALPKLCLPQALQPGEGDWAHVYFTPKFLTQEEGATRPVPIDHVR